MVNFKQVVLSLVGGCLIGGAAVASLMSASQTSQIKPKSGILQMPSELMSSKGDSNLNQDKQPIAQINGETLYGPKALNANQIDSMITAAVLAKDAYNNYPVDAYLTVLDAQNVILSQFWLSKQIEKEIKSITDDQIKKWYEENVKDEQYDKYSVSYYLSGDEKDAKAVFDLVKKGDKEAIKRFVPVKTNDGHNESVSKDAIPYGLGNLLTQMKEGEYLAPVLTRDGYFIIHLESKTSGTKPSLEVVSNEIRNILAQQALSDRIQTLRSQANIILKR